MSTTTRLFVLSCAVLGVAVPAALGQWVDFADQTTTRLPTPLNDPALSTTDPDEKDYAWGDVDQDGDVDLVVVRKEPFTTTGKRANVLFMNEGTAEGHAINGVLVDRTALYASASDVPLDQGFLTPTNDRDVVLHDLDNDGWLDMVTATTLTDNQASHLSHPRVYMNQGESAGVWQGFRYESSRIPVMHPTAGPRFCAVAAGDVTGDGYADLYFVDYDNGVTGDPVQLFDFNNRLLVNQGAANPGVFTDQTSSRLTAEMSYSEFGTSGAIADLNGDGRNDLVKNSSLINPYHVAVTFNSPFSEGQFDQGGTHETVFTLAPYFVNIGDLNGDGRIDLVITDDAADRYLLNQGNNIAGIATWIQYIFPGTEGFGGNSTVADLDMDGFVDVIVTDVDVDVQGCGGRTVILHNQADPPQVTFLEHDQVIPNDDLFGVHDAAVFDINGDGYNDIVMGRCDETQVWMNQPPIGLAYAYPDGRPPFVTPGVMTEILVDITPIGGVVPVSGTEKMFVSVGGGPFVASDLVPVSGVRYRATLPAASCPEQIAYYFRVNTTGGTFTDPPLAPADVYVAVSAIGSTVALRDEIEDDVSGWTIVNDPSLTAGAWEPADPNGTSFGAALAAPDDDATPGFGNVRAFVTQNGPPGGFNFSDDVDGGPTYLISPAIDLAGTDGTISYARWFFCDEQGVGGAADFLTVEVTADGSSWVLVETVAGTGSTWESASFVVGDYVTPSATVQVRFGTSDELDVPASSVTEAGIDDFQVDRFECGASCVADVDGDGSVGFSDLTRVLLAWGDCLGCPEDLTGDGNVGFADLSALLNGWGVCP